MLKTENGIVFDTWTATLLAFERFLGMPGLAPIYLYRTPEGRYFSYHGAEKRSIRGLTEDQAIDLYHALRDKIVEEWDAFPLTVFDE